MEDELEKLKSENQKLKQQGQRLCEYLHFFEKMFLCCQRIDFMEIDNARKTIKKYNNGEWLYPNDIH